MKYQKLKLNDDDQSYAMINQANDEVIVFSSRSTVLGNKYEILSLSVKQFERIFPEEVLSGVINDFDVTSLKSPLHKANMALVSFMSNFLNH